VPSPKRLRTYFSGESKLKHRFIALLVLGFALGCGSNGEEKQNGGDGGDPEKVLKFSAIPDQNTTELKEKFDALAKHLSEKLDVKVEYVPSSDYQASVEAFTTGDIQLAWFGGLTGVQARHEVEGAKAIAQGNSDPVFKSYFIAHQDTGLEKSDEFPTELGGLSFTFGSESSTSGRLMPEFFIKQETGQSPKEFFGKQPGFSGSHDNTVQLVQTGEVQAGVVNFKVYDKRVAEGKTDPEVCKIVWVTPEYADYNFTAHPDLEKKFGEGFIEKLQKTLIEIKDPELLSAFPREALIEAKNEDFQGIADVAKELGFLR